MFKNNPDKCPCGGTFKFSKATRSISCNKCHKEFDAHAGNKQLAKERNPDEDRQSIRHD